MSRREEAKAFNRARIRAAAEDIIRKEGMEKLTMRYLAERAGVSLRTPYNLFGSKTDVLIALIEEADFDLASLNGARNGGGVIEDLLSALDRLEGFFGSDEEYYRSIYEGIMTSDHPEARTTAVARNAGMCRARVRQAVASGELQAGTDADRVGRHLAIEMLAVLGMWGSGFLSNRESIAQVRRAWCAVLLNHCTGTTRPLLEAAYRAALD
jgi:AcrR family transcriptional regulator